jgi:hypothetical protein
MSEDCVDRERLATAVRDWIRRGKVIGHELVAIEIRHEGTSHPVETYETHELPKEDQGEATEDFIERVASKMEGDAGGQRGVFCQYYVEARFSGSKRVAAREPFGLEIDVVGANGKRGRTEKPNAEGVTALALRAMSDMHDRTIKARDRECERLHRQLDASYVREENLRNENGSLRVVIDNMLSSHEERRDNAAARLENRQMLRELFRDAKYGIPVLINRLAGKNTLPEGELGPEQRLLRAFVRDLDGPEVAGAIEMLAQAKPRVALMLAELVMKIQEEDGRRTGITEAAERIIVNSKKLIAEEEASGATVVPGTTPGPVQMPPPAATPKQIPAAVASHRNGAPVFR